MQRLLTETLQDVQTIHPINKLKPVLHLKYKVKSIYIKILGWCPARSVLPLGEKVPL